METLKAGWRSVPEHRSACAAAAHGYTRLFVNGVGDWRHSLRLYLPAYPFADPRRELDQLVAQAKKKALMACADNLENAAQPVARRSRHACRLVFT
jgi:hypothetical protein